MLSRLTWRGPRSLRSTGIGSMYFPKATAGWRSLLRQTCASDSIIPSGDPTIRLSRRQKVDISSPLDTFARRHIGPPIDPTIKRQKDMLKAVGAESLENLVSKVIPPHIRLQRELVLDTDPSRPNRGEQDVLRELRVIASQNQIKRSLIGQGYYGVVTPAVITRNMLENPSWYTPYTPYQGEISQGRLESLLNFQTMVGDMTGLPYANSSLLDEATAAAEAMTLSYNKSRGKKKSFFVARDCHTQTIDVIQTRAESIGIKVIIGNFATFEFPDPKGPDAVCGVLFQYPNTYGGVENHTEFAAAAHEAGALVTCATDLLSLALLKPPADFGADVAIGSSQRFGVPLGYGGPHSAFMAVRTLDLARKMPGRIVGVTTDSRGKKAYRMAMQTREQHIRREKATSNICTAQALLANVAAMYAVYHGPVGIHRISERIHNHATVMQEILNRYGYKGFTGLKPDRIFFDTVVFDCGDNTTKAGIIAKGNLVPEGGFNFRLYEGTTNLGMSFDETTTAMDLERLSEVFQPNNIPLLTAAEVAMEVDPLISQSEFHRTSPYLTHPIFNMHTSETSMMRYIQDLGRKDLGLDRSIIPLGSCTMKLNAASEMMPITWPEFSDIHPFAPTSQTGGYLRVINDLEKWLSEITGFHTVSLQPNSGAQGEFSGLMAIKHYLHHKGETQRNVCLIPVSSHGTNPASAVMAGLKVVLVECTKSGYVDYEHLKEQVEKHKDCLAALMITYPSTYGVFEENIVDVCDLIHENGGQVYMDGANMNAQVGYCNPGDIGADVCHLNLHKTFCIPHGGGGPGVGPIGVGKHLAPFLPSHSQVDVNQTQRADADYKVAGPPVSAAPWGSASILPITWMYVRMMGVDGLKKATAWSILNANYMKSRLEKDFRISFSNDRGYVAHEFIIDCRPLEKATGITNEDIAKRLMDYGFHAPTMSWPVPGTLMLEPTESEDTQMDLLCDALLSIRDEIRKVESGEWDREINPLRLAPHTADMVSASVWDRPYSRETAAYPLPWVIENKFWPSVGRINNVAGDRHLVCSCPPLESYAEEDDDQ
eukprot:TRINITY_DN1945_c0_g1_i3.p1 TRINITY_DN1945_c0_g1~~TRINITY_DN1945_c0_g1_i3.p1  ORF type:complete len:1052 (-),score=195.33 TRINITY_DN1945_c0_g1_i3:1700-4855(-)